MGVQASTSKNAAGKLAFEPKKKGPKFEKVKIGILAFEVSSVMSKSVQLWQSMNEQEVCRLKAEVIRSEGVLNLVSNNESVLLSLACFEKLQDLTWVALAVARLGKRCHEPALAGFEHIYMDILKQNVNVHELGFPVKEMESKVKKMERYIATTSNLYQELEILSEMEQALRRLQDEDDPTQKDNLFALEQKAAWQRQEIKYLKELSLWNRTYEKVVGLLARTICTIYGRIIAVFGFPILGWSQILSISKNGETDDSRSPISCESGELAKLSSFSVNDFAKISNFSANDSAKLSNVCANGSAKLSNPNMNDVTHPKHADVPKPLAHGRNSVVVPTSNGSSDSTAGHSNDGLANGNVDSYIPLSFCFSPGRQFLHHKSPNASREGSPGSSPIDTPIEDCSNSVENSGSLLPSSGSIWQMVLNQHGGGNKLLFDPRNRLQNAPPSTLGGAALALHYANVIIVVEKMVKYPHLISQDARDDLYQMLPKNVRVALRARLRSCMRGCCFPECTGAHDVDWKEALEKILGWLAPLAHNMIRWQSEHNFEQQQVVSRTNVLLLQTLYFADQAKAEAAITEVLVGLNYLWRHERDLQANSLMEYSSNKDLDEYLEWQL